MHTFTFSESEEEEDEEEEDDEEGDEEEEEEDDEPVLKCGRFAKEVVASICEGFDGGRNIICCMAVNPMAQGTS